MQKGQRPLVSSLRNALQRCEYTMKLALMERQLLSYELRMLTPSQVLSVRVCGPS